MYKHPVVMPDPLATNANFQCLTMEPIVFAPVPLGLKPLAILAVGQCQSSITVFTSVQVAQEYHSNNSERFIGFVRLSNCHSRSIIIAHLNF